MACDKVTDVSCRLSWSRTVTSGHIVFSPNNFRSMLPDAEYGRAEVGTMIPLRGAQIVHFGSLSGDERGIVIAAGERIQFRAGGALPYDRRPRARLRAALPTVVAGGRRPRAELRLGGAPGEYSVASFLAIQARTLCGPAPMGAALLGILRCYRAGDLPAQKSKAAAVGAS